MKKWFPFLFLVLLSFTACKKINPDKPSFKGEPIALPPAISTINIPLEIPLRYLEDHLNKGLNELLYSDSGLAVSDGVFTDIEVFRTGDMKLASNGENSLRVKLPMRLKGSLKIEKKIFGQLLSTSIPYDEALSPEISFTPEIGKNWDVAINHLKIESWGRSLRYSLLGYEVDFDPLIRKHIENMLRTQLGSDGLSRISFRNLVGETWKAFSEPIKVTQDNIEAFIYTVPKKIRINEQLTSDNKLRLNIGIEGEVISHVGQRPQTQPGPLPGLFYNGDTSNRLDITLPLAISYAALDNYLNQELANKVFRLDKQTTILPKNLSTQSFGDRTLLHMDFRLERSGKKDLSGELYLVGKPAFNPEKEAIVFNDIEFDLNTKNILANSASWLKQAQLLELISKHASFPIGPYIKDARMELQKRGYISTEFASFRVANPELEVAGIYVTEKDVRLYLNVKGKMDIQLKEAGSLLD